MNADKKLTEAGTVDSINLCDQTVGEHLDQNIRQCREHLESLVILKAKAETAQVLNYPYSFFRSIVHSYPF